MELSGDSIEKKEVEKIILVKVPSQIYSELRKIFINLFENSGFKDIQISENVDFENFILPESSIKIFKICFKNSLCSLILCQRFELCSCYNFHF